jgi:hypothetical protein
VSFGPALSIPRREGVERKDHYEAVSRAMMTAIGELQRQALARADECGDLVDAFGEIRGAGCVPAETPLKYIQGRNGQHGDG